MDAVEFPFQMAFSSFTKLQGGGQPCSPQGMLPLPQATADWTKGPPEPGWANQITSLGVWSWGWESGGEKRVGARSVWVSGPANIEPGAVQRRTEQIHRGKVMMEKGERRALPSRVRSLPWPQGSFPHYVLLMKWLGSPEPTPSKVSQK